MPDFITEYIPALSITQKKGIKDALDITSVSDPAIFSTLFLYPESTFYMRPEDFTVSGDGSSSTELTRLVLDTGADESLSHFVVTDRCGYLGKGETLASGATQIVGFTIDSTNDVDGNLPLDHNLRVTFGVVDSHTGDIPQYDTGIQYSFRRTDVDGMQVRVYSSDSGPYTSDSGWTDVEDPLGRKQHIRCVYNEYGSIEIWRRFFNTQFELLIAIDSIIDNAALTDTTSYATFTQENMSGGPTANGAIKYSNWFYSDLPAASFRAPFATPVVLPDAGLSIYFNDTATSAPKFKLITSSGYFAVKRWTGAMTIYTSGTQVPLTLPTSDTNNIYKVEAWACAGPGNSTPTGYETEYDSVSSAYAAALEMMYISNPSTRFISVDLDSADVLRGYDVYDQIEFDIATNMKKLYMRDMTRIKTVEINNPDGNTTSSAVTSTVFNFSFSPSLQNININSDEVLKYMTIDVSNNDLLGHLDFSKIEINSTSQTANISANPSLTEVTLYGGTIGVFSFAGCNLSAVNIVDTLNVYSTITLSNNNMSHQAVYDMVQDIVAADGTLSIILDGNPCWDGNAFYDDPLKQDLIDYAAANGITFT